MKLKRMGFTLSFLLLAIWPASVAAMTADAAAAEYRRSLEWSFANSPVPLPDFGLIWTLDVATWTLESGDLFPQRPTADGRITGLVFEGSGRFHLEVPDPIELRQLRRFARDPGLEAIDVGFSKLFLRGAGVDLLANIEAPSAGFATHELARERHEHWLRFRVHDADAAVVATLLNPDQRYLRVDMLTDEYGWLTFELDSELREEISLERWDKRNDATESWVSLDRTEDRTPEGRPSREDIDAIAIRHVEVDVDLTQEGRQTISLSESNSVIAEMRATVEYQDLVDGAGALRLGLGVWAEVTAVQDGEGNSLPFLRDHIGARSTAIDKDVYDDDLVVLLATPQQRGSERRLIVDYKIELLGYAPGRSWYPSDGDSQLDLHTAELRLTTPKNLQARAMGERVDETVEGKLTTTTWRVDAPTKMVTFTFARRHYENRLQHEGLPDVVPFGSLGGYMSEQRMEHIAADTVNSLNYFQQLFGPLDADEIYVSAIPASHGQAFEGFLHVGEMGTASGSYRANELLRAHEAAHQWWGHQVGWDGYRHQWLSEAFAEYSSMMFAQVSLKGGDRIFNQMLSAYNDEITGSLKSAFSDFARPGVALLNKNAAERIGPIGHGFRAATGEAPTAYSTQAYIKGALVLHMVRSVLRAMTRSDDAFIATLREFAESQRGRYATTEDFLDVLTHKFPADWTWLADSWIYGAEIPSYVWDYSVVKNPQGKGFLVQLEIEQKDVSPGFRTPVPVRIELSGNRIGEMLVMVDEPRKTVALPVPEKPKKVTFNPDFAVPGKTKKR